MLAIPSDNHYYPIIPTTNEALHIMLIHLMLTSEEEAREATISRQEAMFEIADHSLMWADFIEECGDKSEYKGSVILDWLGY